MNHRAFLRSAVFAAALAAIASAPLCAWASPSAELKSALEVRLPRIASRKGDVTNGLNVIQNDLKKAHPGAIIRTCVEVLWKRSGAITLPAIPEGTLKQQLDALCANTGYTWQADDDWINLIPPGKAADPSYILNKRAPGKIVISRAREDELAAWLAANHVTCLRVIHTLTRLSQPSPGAPGGPKLALGPDTVSLQDPTLRQAICAHEAMYGAVKVSVTVRTLPPISSSSDTSTGYAIYVSQATQ